MKANADPGPVRLRGHHRGPPATKRGGQADRQTEAATSRTQKTTTETARNAFEKSTLAQIYRAAPLAVLKELSLRRREPTNPVGQGPA